MRIGAVLPSRHQDADVLDAVVNGMPWFQKLFDAQGRFGFGLISDTESVDELESFAAGVRADAVEEDVDAISRDGSLSPTTRKALIDARRGQGRFRSELDVHWAHACAATNCKIRAVLRASHIKPWRLSSNTERLDPANGILLAANVDILCDRGLVSFDDDGRMLTSSRLSVDFRPISVKDPTRVSGPTLRIIERRSEPLVLRRG